MSGCGTRTEYVAGCRCAACTLANTIYMQQWKRDREPLPPDDPRHGTQNGYGNYDCRCDRCTAAHTVVAAKRRAQAKAA